MPRPASHKITNERAFDTGDCLAQAFERYEAHCIANPMPIGSKGRTTPRPMSVRGFARFCDVSTTTLYNSAKRPELAEPFAKIKDAIEDDLITGGMLRNLDGNLVARATGLADNQRIQATVDATDDEYDFKLLSDDEMQQLETLLTKCSKSKETTK